MIPRRRGVRKNKIAPPDESGGANRVLGSDEIQPANANVPPVTDTVQPGKIWKHVMHTPCQKVNRDVEFSKQIAEGCIEDAAPDLCARYGAAASDTARALIPLSIE